MVISAMRDLGNKRASRLREATTEQGSSKKKIWRRPEVICETLDQTESGILIGPEIVFNLS